MGESGERRSQQSRSVGGGGGQGNPSPGPSPSGPGGRRAGGSRAQLPPQPETRLETSRELGSGISLRCLATGRTLAGPQANPRCSLKSPTMGEGGGGRSFGTARELQKLKQQAMEYYRENDVPRRLEELLNSTFYLQPADVYGHLVGTWDKHASLQPLSPSPRLALRQRHAPAPQRCARAPPPRASEPSGARSRGGRDPERESASGRRTGAVWARGGQASSPPLRRPARCVARCFLNADLNTA